MSLNNNLSSEITRAKNAELELITNINNKLKYTVVSSNTDANGTVYIGDGDIGSNATFPIMAYFGGSSYQEATILSFMSNNKMHYAVRIRNYDGSFFANKSVAFWVLWAKATI